MGRELATKLSRVICRCGNVHPPDKGLTLYIDPLHPTIRSVVARYKESHRQATYLNIVDYIQLGEDAVRARALTFQALRLAKSFQKLQWAALL